jgi:methionyl aminopeptidase
MTKRLEEIALLTESGKLLADVFGYLDQMNMIGMSTMQVNDLVDSLIVHELDARPASKGQYGYAYALNSSRNNVVCHGVPSTMDILQSGDIVNFDITLEKNGYIADSSKTYLVGEVNPQAKRLVQVTYEAMWKGIKAVRPGRRCGTCRRAARSQKRLFGRQAILQASHWA